MDDLHPDAPHLHGPPLDERPLFQPLQDWQDARGVKDGELASDALCDVTTLQRAKRGDLKISMRLQIRLRRITGIRPSQWADFFEETEPLRAAKRPIEEGARA